MSERLVAIKTIGYGLAGIYGLGLFIYLVALMASFVNPEAVLQSFLCAGKISSIVEFQLQALILWVLFFPQFIGFLAVARFQDWGRQIVIVMNLALCLHAAYKVIFLTRSASPMDLLSMGVFIIIILFFDQDHIREQFRRSSIKKKRVLLVDDDKGLVRMVKSSLSAQGYDVMTAWTGEVGLHLAKREKPDLILLDVILPGMKGREVCTRLKADTDTRSIPVIFLTAKDSPDDVKAEMEAGGICHLTKPVNAQKLLAEIKRVLGS